MRLVYNNVNHIQECYHRWDSGERRYIQGNARIKVISCVEWGLEKIIHESEYERWDGITRVFDYAIWITNDFKLPNN